MRPQRWYHVTQLVHVVTIYWNERFLACPINTTHCSVHPPLMYCWQLWQPVSTQLWISQHGASCINNLQGILQVVGWRGETNLQILHDGCFWWNHEEAAATRIVPRFHFQETRQISGVLQKKRARFCHGIYFDLNCLILITKILSILTHFVLNSHVQQRQSSELSSGKAQGHT